MGEKKTLMGVGTLMKKKIGKCITKLLIRFLVFSVSVIYIISKMPRNAMKVDGNFFPITFPQFSRGIFVMAEYINKLFLNLNFLIRVALIFFSFLSDKVSGVRFPTLCCISFKLPPTVFLYTFSVCAVRCFLAEINSKILFTTPPPPTILSYCH